MSEISFCLVLCFVVLSEMAELLMLRKEHVRAIEALKEAASLQRRLLPTNHHHTALSERL